MSNFDQVLESYPPPHETQMKTRLQGRQARPQASGQYSITDLRLETFAEDGRREMLVEAPQCLYDSTRRAASSPGSLRVQAADGKFSIEGDGFLWQQTNSSLTISNHVHTTAQPELLGPSWNVRTNQAAGSAEPPIEVFSDQFAYSAAASEAAYRGQVRVAGRNLNLTCGLLKLKLPLRERQLETITFEQSVVADYADIHATGDRADYSVQSGRLKVAGHPTWRTQSREGGSDELELDQPNQRLNAEGAAWLRIPAQTLGPSGFLLRTNSSAVNSSATNQFVEIHSQTYQLQTNQALFRGGVLLEELVGDQRQGQLRCQRLSATFAGTNQLQTMIAEHEVEIAQNDRLFTAASAVYQATDDLLELTEHPTWRAGSREGSGDSIQLNLRTDEMKVAGNGFLRLPAAEFGQAGFPLRGSNVPAANALTNQFAEIYADDYTFGRQAGQFRGRVRIEHPQMRWTCEQMAAYFGAGAQVERIVADGKVVFDLTDEREQKLQGKGEQAVYDYRVTSTTTNSTLNLTGNPAVLQTTNGTWQNALFILDLVHQQLLAPGKYKIIVPESGGQTNQLRWKRGKF